MACGSGRSDQQNRLLLLCAETPAQRRRLLAAAVRHLQHQGAQPRLIDLDGLAVVSDALVPSARFCASSYGSTVWQSLQPTLAPWLQLLELEPGRGWNPGPIPGLVDLLRLLFLAEAWETAEQGDQVLVVLMPPLGQSIAMLRLAAQGPELLESLWSPLLHWWGETRQRLAQFELVLRLRLPTADGLFLSPLWQRRLMVLAQQLQPDAGCEMQWAVALEAEDAGLLLPQVAALSFAGRARQRLWIETATAWSLPVDLEAQLAVPLLISQGPPTEAAWAGWQQQCGPAQVVQWSERKGERECSLMLPGVGAEGLEVLTADRRLVLQNKDHRLDVPFPDGWPELTCRSARFVASQLMIAFEA